MLLPRYTQIHSDTLRYKQMQEKIQLLMRLAIRQIFKLISPLTYNVRHAIFYNYQLSASVYPALQVAYWLV